MNKKRGTPHDKPNAAIDDSPPAQEALVVDAGAAPVEFIKQARPLSVDATALDAGPPRISVVQPRAELPLNPLRAGSAIAKGGPQVRAVVPADTEGGAAPKPPARKKNQPTLTRNSKSRPTRSRKRKR